MITIHSSYVYIVLQGLKIWWEPKYKRTKIRILPCMFYNNAHHGTAAVYRDEPKLNLIRHSNIYSLMCALRLHRVTMSLVCYRSALSFDPAENEVGFGA